MSEESTENTTAMRLLRLVTASWMSSAMSAVAELGVADRLAAGPRPVTDLAADVGAAPGPLYRLLRACADIGLFRESAGQVFALTDLGDGLRSDSPHSLRNFVRWVGLAADRHTWSDLAQTVRTGEPAFERVHGKQVWEYFRDSPEVAEVFDNAMTELSDHVIKPVVDAYDFGRFRRIVDVGGGHGSLLATVLTANPAATGVLFDQPEVIASAGAPLDEAGVRDRCQLVDGDFFVGVPPGGDAYLMSNIIHDWDDEPSRRILANCREAMADGGRVLLVEAVVPDGVASSPTVKLMDLDMLVISGGRQRTGAQFDALFQDAGLKLSGIVPAGLCSVVEAVRA
ncbi:methyltransferase [Actinosynnema sp. NPDC047251]|uniref:Methyltransferase n=1 Tax=Saccharothrix espanaensis (strain ATCC 51144 / DSM 44229 / JCM 9112 / NBRC 15066 / NRRL 15764) TaxID=1179773 RepID=K0JXT0_SACES|nr:methyltransferase [Saccharothrix espanaensis]CCH32735.1 Methyltransferase [Saccharothrix espanaensis DSM 44229]